MTGAIVVTAAGSSSNPGQGSSPQSGTVLVKLANAKILVTSTGMTLYVFAKDPANKSMCYGTCAKYWPPYLVAKGTTPAASMSGIPGTFGTVARTDGTQQLTYDGAPLYTFLGDKKPGDMNGQGLTASGGYWWVVVAAGKQPTQPTPTPSAGGYGYNK
jgi:predicted lipoprotein with Yx(FWY)xxD motif